MNGFQQEIFCIDYTDFKRSEKPKDFDQKTQTIPELVYLKCHVDRVAAVFDSEKVSLTFMKVRTEVKQILTYSNPLCYQMEALAAGLLSLGLDVGDRVLICGSNYSAAYIAAFACARAGMVFSMTTPNIQSPHQLERMLQMGGFRAIICFRSSIESDHLNDLLLHFAPELRSSPKGQLKSKIVPELTHVILAEEDHKHAGTFTLSEVFGRSSADRIAKLPNFERWNSHQLAAIQFTMGSTGEPKMVGLSHYQLLNGARSVVHAFGIKKEHAIACALPFFRIPIFSLVCLAPFLTECRAVFPEPSPLPRFLFQSINKYNCTTLLSNAAALRLLLKISNANRVRLTSLENFLLIGERVPTELVTAIRKEVPNTKIVAVGYLLTETGSVPLMADETANLYKVVGRPIAGYEIEVVGVGSEKPVQVGGLGELRVKAYGGSTFLGYGPNLKGGEEWINTGDIARLDESGNVELVTHKEDLIYDTAKRLVEHWNIEKLLSQNELLKGIQVVSTAPGQPVTAVCLPKNPDIDPRVLKADVVAMCHAHRVRVPDVFAFVEDYPRVNMKVQKYKIREMLAKGEIITHLN